MVNIELINTLVELKVAFEIEEEYANAQLISDTIKCISELEKTINELKQQ